MPRGFAMQKLLMFLALYLAGAIFANSGTAQPVGGPATGGNDPTGGNAPVEIRPEATPPGAMSIPEAMLA